MWSRDLLELSEEEESEVARFKPAGNEEGDGVVEMDMDGGEAVTVAPNEAILLGDPVPVVPAPQANLLGSLERTSPHASPKRKAPLECPGVLLDLLELHVPLLI